jgi:hypothetical protein
MPTHEMKTFLNTKRVDQADLRVDFTDWTLNSVDEYVEKFSEIVNENAQERLKEVILKAAAEALEIAISEEGIFVHISSDDDDIPCIRISIPISGLDGILFEVSLADLADMHGRDMEGELFAKHLRYIADVIDPPGNKP